MTDDPFLDAVRAAVHAHRQGQDIGEWAAQVLAAAAGHLGSTDALVANRPGSWEASLVEQLVRGTVGHDDGLLSGHRVDLATRRVWVLWEYGDLVGVYVDEETARSDADALRAAFAKDFGDRRAHIEVGWVTVRSRRQF